MKRLLLLGSCCLLLCVSCKQDPRYVVPLSVPTPTIDILRYDKELFESHQIADSAFWHLYTEDILQIGSPEQAETLALIELFCQDPDILQVQQDVLAQFPQTIQLEKQLSKAFRRLCHFIPNMPVPQVSLHLSGFGQSIVSAPAILSASIDKFLGADYPVYQELFHPYQRHRMSPEFLPYELMNGWLRSEFTHESLMQDNRLLDYLVYEGKLFFLMTRLFPKASMEYFNGWDRSQLEWCQQNEARAWKRLQEYDHLLSRDPLVLSKYIGEAPYTVYFTEDSPSRAVVWNGYQLIEAYMNRHPQCAIIEMMMQTDADSLLMESFYRP